MGTIGSCSGLKPLNLSRSLDRHPKSAGHDGYDGSFGYVSCLILAKFMSAHQVIQRLHMEKRQSLSWCWGPSFMIVLHVGPLGKESFCRQDMEESPQHEPRDFKQPYATLC